jgi:hypothetical protein
MSNVPMHVPVVRTLIVSLVLIGLGVAVVAALTGFVLVLALAVGLGALNLVYLPRIARVLRIRAGWLALMLIPFMILAAAIAGGVEGAAWGAGIWLVAIGLPRALGRDLVRRVRRRVAARLNYYDVPAGPVRANEARKSTTDPGGRPLPPASDPGRGESGP